MLTKANIGNWQEERRRWKRHYQDRLAQQLRTATQYVQTHQQQPDRIRPHFESCLALLNQTRHRVDLHTSWVALVVALHPWPLRWGLWSVWEQELEQALLLLTAFKQVVKQAELMTYLAEIQFRTGRLETAVHTSRTALTLAWKNQTVVTWAVAGRQAVSTLSRLGHNEETRRLLSKLELQLAEATFTISATERLEASGHLLLPRMIFVRHDGRPSEAAQRAQFLIEKLLPLPQIDLNLMAALYKDQATMLWAADQYEQAVTSLQQAIAIYAALGDIYEETAARGNLGIVYWSMSRLNEAEAAIRESLHMAEILNARWRMMNEMGNLCAVSFSQGKLAQALQFTKRHLALAQEADDAAEINRAHGNWVIISLYLGNYAIALPVLEESIAQLQRLGLQQQLAESYIHLSYCLAGLGRRAEAKTAVAHTATTLISQIDSPILNGMILRCRALFVSAAEATALMEQALASSRHLQRPLDEGRCLLRLSILASGQRREELWTEGVTIMKAIGAEAWVDGYSPDSPPAIAMVL